MSRRWTPQRFIIQRRIRIAVCVAGVFLISALAFAFGAHKTVALEINGERREVTTYAMSVPRLLQEQGVNVQTHDFVQSSSSELLANHAQVNVKKAYQTYVTVNGKQMAFWTVANSVDQLINFFKQNDAAVDRIQVDIPNVYNQLTGGLVINHDGPVTVIADGKSSVAPNGKLPAASILDAKGITVQKDDRVIVQQDNNETILRVQRVTYGDVTKVVPIAFDTQTVTDESLEPGQTVVRQQGVAGERTETYHVTYVDGQEESATLTKSEVTKIPLDQIVAVGPAKPAQQHNSDSANGGSGTNSTNGNSSSSDKAKSNGSGKNTDNSSTDTKSDSGSSKNESGTSDNSDENNTSGNSSQSESNNSNNDASNSNTANTDNSNTQNNQSQSQSTPAPQPQPAPAPQPTPSAEASAGLWHPTVAQAQAYAAAAAAQYGWTGAQWDALVWIWDHESGWRWDADNPRSDAYGIPQALPGSKMGSGWQDDGAVQINWGLQYISQRYGSPLSAKQYWLAHNWY